MKSHYKKIVIAGVAVLIIISFILLTKNQDNLKVDSNIDIDKKLTSIDFTNVSKKNIDLNQYQGDLKLEGQEVFEITGELEGTLLIETTENVKLILNKVTIKSKNGPAIYIKNASNVHIEVIGENTLVDNSNYTNYEEYGTLLSHDDLYIFGSGTLNVESNKEDAIVSKDDLVIEGVTLNIKSVDDGIRGKDSVTLKSGTFNIEAEKDGIKSTNIDDENKGYVLIENGTIQIDAKDDGIESVSKTLIQNGDVKINSKGKGIKSESNIILSSGNITIESDDDSIHSNNSIEISGGHYNITSDDDGIHANSVLLIKGGNINIHKSYEGLEAEQITITNGTINVVASDDGINCAGGNDGSSFDRPGQNQFAGNGNGLLNISGGKITVNAAGDGLDANGSIKMSGGYVIVDGPTNNGNGPLDYDASFTMTGGTIIAIGSSGMAQNVSTSSTQPGILVNLSNNYASGSKITIDGVIEHTSAKSFNSVMVSSPNLKIGNSYNLKINNSVVNTISVNSIVTGTGNTMGGGGPRPPR